MDSHKFINIWNKEINFLESLYDKTQTEPQLLVLDGRRRLGKTYLLKKFIQNKPSIYFLCTSGSIKDQLKYAARISLEHFGDYHTKEDQFQSWGSLLKYIASKTSEKKEKLVLIFDELSNLIDSEKTISQDFQKAWEQHLKPAKIFFIAVGSNVLLSSKNNFGHSRLFYNKKTNELFLDTFSFHRSRPIFNSDDFEKCFSWYALVGGIPKYILKFDNNKNFEENIKTNILSKENFLSMEPQLLLSEEFSEPRKYFTILEAIGLGWVKYGDIIERTGFANNVLSKYLNTLINLKLVQRKIPVTENPLKSKKGIYFISDNFLRLYFNFILPNLSHIELGDIDTVFEDNKDILNVLIGRAYEVLVTEIISAQTTLGRLPEFYPIDRWWKGTIKIDAVGLNNKLNSIIFAKTRWSSEPLGIDILSDLKLKALHVKWGKKSRIEYYILLSKSGFTQELIKYATNEKNILLVRGDQLLDLKK